MSNQINQEQSEKQVTKKFPSLEQLEEFFSTNKEYFLEYRMNNTRSAKLDEPNDYSITFWIEASKEEIIAMPGEIEMLYSMEEVA